MLRKKTSRFDCISLYNRRKREHPPTTYKTEPELRLHSYVTMENMSNAKNAAGFLEKTSNPKSRSNWLP